MCTQITGEAPKKYVPGERYMGVDISKIVMTAIDGADHFGEMQAWDLDTGKRVWTTNLPSQNWGPVLATGGGLLFSGGTNDRKFRLTRRAEPFSGNFRPDPVSTESLFRFKSMANSTSQFNPAGASMRPACSLG
jgi:hypothetical protein